MKMGRLLAAGERSSWFTLDDLVESVLADVVEADANFQLTQAAAWREFGKAINEFGRLPTVERVDFAVGFGRLENLGLSDLSVQLPLEVYRAGWLRRCWWGLIKLFGARVPPREERYRLAADGNRGVIELTIKARRDGQGRWTVDRDVA